MIILDTNVISELMRHQSHEAVINWLDKQTDEELAITSVTVAEILYGVKQLPSGKRKTQLYEAAMMMFEEDFPDLVLSFDRGAAEYYADIVSTRGHIGKPINIADAQIAAICRVYGAVLATRNTKDFEHIEIMLINPWKK